ncbi:hypothetical protein [Streptomyces sp. KM273126]|uniref:hypothetical protein n=1 Tax=Streptomyces sp. KM273126 TaxID=2545247 RepID=UPI00269E96A4
MRDSVDDLADEPRAGRGHLDLAIPGTGNPDHLAENVAAGALRLTADGTARLDGLRQKAG